jgi:hypothetical protein
MTDLAKVWLRDMRRTKIREPRDDQRVESCHWSKTGWAIVESDGCCTCQPAKAPTFSEERQTL